MYKIKYLERKIGGEYPFVYIRCCDTNLKLIQAHGRMLGSKYAFHMPLGCNLITIMKYGVSSPFSKNYFLAESPIRESIRYLYQEGHTLFKNNDKSLTLTQRGKDLQESLNKNLSKSDTFREGNLEFRNHLPWVYDILYKHKQDETRFLYHLNEFKKNEGIRKKEILLNPDIKIIEYNNDYRYFDPNTMEIYPIDIKQRGYYFPDGIKDFNNFRKILIEDYLVVGNSKTDKNIFMDIQRDLKKNKLLGGSATKYMLDKVYCRITLISEKTQEIKYLVPAGKIVLLDEKQDAIKCNNTILDFTARETGSLVECNILCIDSSGLSNKLPCGKNGLVINIQQLINSEGPGTYILNACRGIDELTEKDKKFGRDLSSKKLF